MSCIKRLGMVLLLSLSLGFMSMGCNLIEGEEEDDGIGLILLLWWLSQQSSSGSGYTITIPTGVAQ